MKARYHKLFSIVSSIVLTTVVTVGIKPACLGWIYQPKAPKHLLER